MSGLSQAPAPFSLAPMAELSHRALRELVEGFCAERGLPGPVYFTEMISAAGLLSGGPFEKWYLDGGPAPGRLVYQLLGADAGVMARAAAILERRECLGIDINMGCAAPAITRTGAGVRLMENIDRAAGIVRAVRAATTKRLSVKLRLGPKSRSPAGGQDAAGNRDAAGDRGAASGPEDLPGLGRLLRFCRRLVEEGVDYITLHPRGAADKFRGRARWEYVAALRRALPVPVAGNGGIEGSGDMLRRAREGPVMAGRAAVRAPWIFARALDTADAASPAPDTAFLEEAALRFLGLLSRHQPPEFHLSRARRFFHYYCDNFTWAEYLRNLLNRETTLVGLARVLRDYCRENPQ